LFPAMTTSTTLRVAGSVFAHVPYRAGFGAGGTGLASAETENGSCAAAAAAVMINAAITALGVRFTPSPLVRERPAFLAVLVTDSERARAS
jgi:hypothetical protein